MPPCAMAGGAGQGHSVYGRLSVVVRCRTMRCGHRHIYLPDRSGHPHRRGSGILPLPSSRGAAPGISSSPAPTADSLPPDAGRAIHARGKRELQSQGTADGDAGLSFFRACLIHGPLLCNGPSAPRRLYSFGPRAQPCSELLSIYSNRRPST